eukprot:1988587-Rhodomonas_salina.2
MEAFNLCDSRPESANNMSLVPETSASAPQTAAQSAQVETDPLTLPTAFKRACSSSISVRPGSAWRM